MNDNASPLTQGQGAALAGVTLRHFARLLTQPGAPPQVATPEGRSKGLPIAPFRAWLRSRIVAELGGGDALSPPAERARLDARRADLAELELGRKRGELVPVSEVAAAWSEQVAIAKGRLMALPARTAPALIRCRDLRSVEGLLRDAIYTVLEELAKDAATYGLPPDPEAPANPSAPA